MDSFVKKNSPFELDQLISYQQMMIEKCESFEAAMGRFWDKKSESDSCLSESLNKALEEIRENVSKAYFQRVYHLLNEINFNDVMIGSSSESIQKAIYYFPECCIHSNVLDLCDIVKDVLSEISKTESPLLQNILSKTVRSILDIYRAHLLLLRNQNGNLTPHLLMVYHNDCHYIAHYCQIWLIKEYNLQQTTHTVVDLVTQFREMSLLFFNDATKMQQFIVVDILKEMGGLQCETGYLKIQRVLHKVSFQMKHLSKIWKVSSCNVF